MPKLSKHKLEPFNYGDHTPTPSETDELEALYDLADWLIEACKRRAISNKRYIELATYLDTIPVIGCYYRRKCFSF